ncbi:glycoside hydrolase family 19 protein [Deinococcus misasensis]|uniref:glycoside hydrolase family 19 protein n=1 Tax=Deinococcus misasensis TaxID=392413 RepID=UPI001B80C3DA|nr:glycoside hydrolase family 19 protein [Deinococcus misasensis]
MITPELIRKINPSAPRPDIMAEKFQKAADQHGINTKLRVAHFLAQLAAESRLVPQEENLNYSAKRLREVWPARFPTLESAQPYAMNPEALGDKVYGGRMGNTQPGDGFKYRGRGFIQLTGRDNYATYGELTGFDLVGNPDLLLQIGVGAQVAAAYWKARNLNRFADQDKIRGVTRGINGGLNGLEHRAQYLRLIKQHFGI